VLREAYVRAARQARRGADAAGVTRRLAERPGRTALYLRSLLAIYDVDAMLELDTPWWTFRAIDRVDAFLRAREGTARVFEFGAGASTPWLARRAGEVHSLEYDPSFAAHVEAVVVAAGATLHVVTGEPTPSPVVRSAHRHHRDEDFSAYVRTIDDIGGEFDLIVIDGRARDACLHASLPHLAPDGLLVLDDAWRSRYRAGLRAHPDVSVEPLWGLTPSLPYPSCTALVRHAPSDP
jgi:hypothetical protein